MNNDFKPFIFWIICGVILIVELAFFFVLEPTKKMKGRRPQDAYKVAKDFNDQFKKLKDDFDARSMSTEQLGNKTVPDLINPADPNSINRVLGKYIVGGDWVNIIDQKRQEYQKIHKDLKGHLHGSSNMLGTPVSEHHTVTAMTTLWYSDYSKAVADFLIEIGGTGALGPLSENQRDKQWLTLNMDAKPLRDRFGFVTTDTTYPTAGQHVGLTKRFRIVEVLGKALAGAQGTVTRDPLLSQKIVIPDPTNPEKTKEVAVVDVPSPEDNPGLGRVFIESIHVGDAPVGGGEGPQCWEVEIHLKGTPGALFAAIKVLDEMHRPIVVRLGAQWTHLTPDKNQRLKTDARDLWFGLATKVIVCDFSHFPPAAGN